MSPTWSRGAVLIVVVVLLVAGISAAVWAVTRSPTASRVLVEICPSTFGGLLNISYLGNQSGYLTTGYFAEPYICYSELVPPGSNISLGFGLHSYDHVNSHVIQSFSVLPPYSLAAFSPRLPTSIAAGGNLSFAVTVHVPTTPGSYGGPGASLTVL